MERKIKNTNYRSYLCRIWSDIGGIMKSQRTPLNRWKNNHSSKCIRTRNTSSYLGNFLNINLLFSRIHIVFLWTNASKYHEEYPHQVTLTPALSGKRPFNAFSQRQRLFSAELTPFLCGRRGWISWIVRQKFNFSSFDTEIRKRASWRNIAMFSEFMGDIG